MKKLFAILLCLALCASAVPGLALCVPPASDLTLCVPPAAVVPDDAFLSLTGLDKMLDLLDGGATIEKVYYTDGLGFSVSEFTTTDPEEINALLVTLTAMKLGERVDQFITDWYPQIVFFLSDGSLHRVCFNKHWLEIHGMENYEVEHGEWFWMLTSFLVSQYEATSN